MYVRKSTDNWAALSYSTSSSVHKTEDGQSQCSASKRRNRGAAINRVNPTKIFSVVTQVFSIDVRFCTD